LVDDDNAVRDVTAELLRELGYDVAEAGSGGAALELLEASSNVDLVIVDFAMPGMNGAELGRQIHSKWPSIPLLFVTGFADRNVIAGINESQIVGKPFVGTELADKIRTVLSRAPQGNVVPLRRSEA
jgi:CheY-like chemotaxis protein